MNDKTYLTLSIRICEGFILLIRSNQIAQGSNPFDASNESDPSDDETVASTADLAANDEEELVPFGFAESFVASFPRDPQIDACSAHRSRAGGSESGGSAERQRVASARSAVALRAMARRLLVRSAEILGNWAGRRHRKRAGDSLRDRNSVLDRVDGSGEQNAEPSADQASHGVHQRAKRIGGAEFGAEHHSDRTLIDRDSICAGRRNRDHHAMHSPAFRR